MRPSLPVALPFVLAAICATLPVLAQTHVDMTAKQIMSQAEATAKSEHKSVLLDFGASWCGNCHLWDHFIEDRTVHPILDKYFVMVTLISGEQDSDTRHSNTPGAKQFEDSVGGKGAGWPFIVILDDAGRPIVDNYRPDPKTKGGRVNIGYPDYPAEVDWFMEMLKQSAAPLSPQELSTVHTWLTAHGHPNK